MKESKLLCPFCSTEFTEEMMEIYNGSYGCESGCGYVTFEVTCDNCDKLVYEKGSIGEYDNEEEKKEFISEFIEEIKDEKNND